HLLGRFAHTLAQITQDVPHARSVSGSLLTMSREDLEHAAPPSTADPDDRRGDGRTPIMLRVDYKRLNSFFADYTKNISKGGTFIRTNKPLEIGTEFVFVLNMPEPTLDGAALKLELTGVVK